MIKKRTEEIAQIDQNINLASNKQEENEEAIILKAELETLKNEAKINEEGEREYQDFLRRKSEIETLKAELKVISTDLSTKKHLLNQAEDASLAKYKAIEKQINDKFKTVQIKLFDIPMNGDVKETCKVMVDGVEFGAGLNTAASINADLEIKQVFMKHYDIALPVFIDNTESVTSPIELDTQCFFLKVEKGVKELEWK